MIDHHLVDYLQTLSSHYGTRQTMVAIANRIILIAIAGASAFAPQMPFEVCILVSAAVLLLSTIGYIELGHLRLVQVRLRRELSEVMTRLAPEVRDLYINRAWRAREPIGFAINVVLVAEPLLWGSLSLLLLWTRYFLVAETDQAQDALRTVIEGFGLA